MQFWKFQTCPKTWKIGMHFPLNIPVTMHFKSFADLFLIIEYISLGHGDAILHQPDGKCKQLFMDAATTSKKTKMISIDEILTKIPEHLAKCIIQFHALTG